MKNIGKIIVALTVIVITAPWAIAQKVDTERMDRDIEIAENALATIIKQQFEKKGMWVEVKANYTPGFGVTMRLPNDNSNWIYEYNTTKARAVVGAGSGTYVIVDNDDDDDSKDKNKEKDSDKARVEREKRRNDARDSARTVFYARMIKASKDFIADYGDLLSQLQPDEKILITNRGDGSRWQYEYNNKSQKRMLVTVEGTKSDISQLRQGKISREQMMSKIKVVNTESLNEVETDLELLSSIMSRLYRSDLSKTFYTDETIYYERLKDFGVIYYMSAYSGVEQDRSPRETSTGKIWRMPTQRLEGLTQEQRDKKVVELYPQFEKDLKENIVEYAQTVKSLKNDEMLVFNVQLTKCVGCNIPATLELSVRNDNVRKLAAGQMSKADVVSSINVKKGANQ
ncbi:MAG TPA: hypothetical protein VK508_07500 [Cyclobacteriaceae bacterium]|nr:hypothetical protein [Cyclobacteriaceae bacterium]